MQIPFPILRLVISKVVDYYLWGYNKFISPNSWISKPGDVVPRPGEGSCSYRHSTPQGRRSPRPPSPPTTMPLTDVFLCSLPPHACCTLFPLVSSCISHLSASHPEHAHLIHTDGQVGLQKLPTAITLSSPPDPLGTLVWVCDDCRRLFSTRAGFAAHWKQDRKHRTWAARTLSEEGERGCNRFINATARGMVIKARAEVNNYFVSAAAREAVSPPPPTRLARRD